MPDNNVKDFTVADSSKRYNAVKNVELCSNKEVKTLSDLDSSISELANLVEKLKKRSKKIAEK